MNIDTPFFRGALSLAAIWLVAYAIITYQSYRSEYQDTYGITFFVDPDITADCYNLTLDFIGKEPTWREATAQEKEDCVDRLSDSHRKLVRNSNEQLAWQSWENFLKFAVLPTVALLTAIAFWRRLTEVCLGIVKRYANWLRYGTKDSFRDKEGSGNTQ